MMIPAVTNIQAVAKTGAVERYFTRYCICIDITPRVDVNLLA